MALAGQRWIGSRWDGAALDRAGGALCSAHVPRSAAAPRLSS